MIVGLKVRITGYKGGQTTVQITGQGGYKGGQTTC